jgi:hypothetical protein
LPSPFREAEAIPVTTIIEVAHPQSGHRSDSRSHVDQNGDHGPVAQAHHMFHVDAPEQPPRMFNRNFRRLPLDHLIPFCPDGKSRIQQHHVP